MLLSGHMPTLMSLLAFFIPWAHPLDIKITKKPPTFLNSENSFMQECCCAVSDRGITSDAAKKIASSGSNSTSQLVKEHKEPATHWLDSIQIASKRCFGACHGGCDLYHVLSTPTNFPEKAENKTLTGKGTAESSKRERSGLWGKKSNTF